MKLSELRTRESLDERLEATLMACARRDASLGEAVSVDERLGGEIPSTKGVL